MQVTFTHKDGREKRMPVKHAEILRKLGRGTYQPQDTQAAAEPPKASEQPQARTTKGKTKK